MADIIVTVPKDEVRHFLEDKLDVERFNMCWWYLPSTPRNFNYNDRVGFVINGALRYIAENAWLDFDGAGDGVTAMACFRPENVWQCEPIEMKGFRGFRYYPLGPEKEEK